MDKDLVEKVEKTARKVCAEANRDIWSDDELATLIAERLGVEEKAVADALRMIPHERIVGKDGDVIALAKGRFLQVYVDDSGALAVRLTDCPIGEWHDGILISIEGRWAIFRAGDRYEVYDRPKEVVALASLYYVEAAKYLAHKWAVSPA